VKVVGKQAGVRHATGIYVAYVVGGVQLLLIAEDMVWEFG